MYVCSNPFIFIPLVSGYKAYNFIGFFIIGLVESTPSMKSWITLAQKKKNARLIMLLESPYLL